MPVLGVVGGIAPGSTIDYYRRLLARYRALRPDGGYPPLIINSIDLQSFLALVGAGDQSRLVEYLLGELTRLAAAGATVGLFASNTPHLVFDQLATRSPIPLLSIVEATARAARARGHRRLGLLGTRFTMEGGFYPAVFRRFDLSVVTPTPPDRDYVHQRYVSELINESFRQETRQGMLAVIERMRERDGVDGVILGGTELPLLFGDADISPVPLLDTTAFHVEEAVAAILGHPLP